MYEDEVIRFWQDLERKLNPSMDDKFLLGNVATGGLNYVDLSDLPFIPYTGTPTGKSITGQLSFTSDTGIRSFSGAGSVLFRESGSFTDIYGMGGISLKSGIYANIDLNTSNGGKALYNGEEIATVGIVGDYIPYTGTPTGKSITGQLSFTSDTGIRSFSGAGSVLFRESGSFTDIYGMGGISLKSGIYANIDLNTSNSGKALYNGNEIATVSQTKVASSDSSVDVTYNVEGGKDLSVKSEKLFYKKISDPDTTVPASGNPAVLSQEQFDAMIVNGFVSIDEINIYKSYRLSLNELGGVYNNIAVDLVAQSYSKTPPSPFNSLSFSSSQPFWIGHYVNEEFRDLDFLLCVNDNSEYMVYYAQDGFPDMYMILGQIQFPYYNSNSSTLYGNSERNYNVSEALDDLFEQIKNIINSN
ncbi:hypothetical protein LJC11_03050 [Bacteroidales bacterium OttesenSCG-928-I21]|nr:hypothetical protein [Bacteroidales bacterium OttesenSCG-928-I21]